MTQDEKDLANGKRIRLKKIAEEDLQLARCKAEEIVRSLNECIRALENEENLPMSSPDYEEVKLVYDNINDAKGCIADLSVGIIDY